MVGWRDGAGQLIVPGRPTAFAYSLFFLQQVQDGWAVFFVIFPFVYPIFPFLMSHLLGDDWT